MGFKAPQVMAVATISRLSYGNSTSTWFRDTTEVSFEADPLLNDGFGDHKPEARRDFVVEAIEEKLEREDE